MVRPNHKCKNREPMRCVCRYCGFINTVRRVLRCKIILKINDVIWKVGNFSYYTLFPNLACQLDDIGMVCNKRDALQHITQSLECCAPFSLLTTWNGKVCGDDYIMLCCRRSVAVNFIYKCMNHDCTHYIKIIITNKCWISEYTHSSSSSM